MNNRFLGNAACLAKYDLLIKLSQYLNLPAWYVSMLTESEDRNKGDRNATNYRLGSKNETLVELMKTSFYGEESSINDITDYLRQQKVRLKAVAIRNNQKAENYRIGNITFFNHKERIDYFQGLPALLESNTKQLLFVDPDAGVIPAKVKLKSAKGNSVITSTELRALLNNLTDDSIVMVSQQLNDYSYLHQARVQDLKQDIESNIILLVDEVIQSGIYFFTKNQPAFESLATFLGEYVADYRFVKSSERIELVGGITTNASSNS